MPIGSGDGWAEDYERGRPGWPPGVVDVVRLDPRAAVVDLAAGTGKLTRVLTSAYGRVIAVEPAFAMRRILQEMCPDAVALGGSAEAIPLDNESVDAVFVGQGFHNFDAERAVTEIVRILRPGGAVVLAFNVPTGPWEPSAAAAEAVLTERGPREVPYIPLDLGEPNYDAENWPFAHPSFESLQQLRLTNPQTLDRDGLVAFYASMGWVGDLPDAERVPLLAQVKSRLSATDYRREWQTQIYATRLVEVPSP